MKKVFLFTALFFAIASSFSQVKVSGYYKSNGTYVEEHYRSLPNNTVYDNYSTYGNTNPYTGNVGMKSVNSSYSNYSTCSYPTDYYPSTPSYATPTSSTVPIYTGPRGGTYYINSNGNKTYVKNR